MKATYTQIENALNNNFDFKKGTQQQYEAIRACENEAIERAGIKKTRYHFNKSDWKKVYTEIKKMIAQ